MQLVKNLGLVKHLLDIPKTKYVNKYFLPLGNILTILKYYNKKINPMTSDKQIDNQDHNVEVL